MPNGWGGRRRGSGQKRRNGPVPTGAASLARAGDPAGAKVAATVENAPAGSPARSRPMTFEQMLSAVEASRAHARTRPRTVDWCPFKIAEHPATATPPEAKKIRMAQDEALVANNTWAATAWMQGGMFGAMESEGLVFLGYPYLAELAQRPEYRVISETIATEMTRKWIRFKGSGEDDKTEKIKELTDFLEDLHVRDRFADIALQDGQFGRSHLFLDPGDATDDELKTPIGNGRDALSKGKISKGWLRAVRTVEPVWVYPTTYNAQNPLSPDWYNPQVWYVMGKEIHRSRLPVFIGRPVPDMLKPAYSFGGLSLSQMVKPYVDIWLQTRQSVAELVHSFSVMVLSTDMSTRLQSGASDLLARVALFNALRDNQGAFVINKDSEDFKNVSAPLAGMSDLQAQSQEHIMSIARIPAIKYTGLQPTGLNASSEGEMRAFNETIAAYQPKLFGPNLDFVIDVAMITLWGERDPDISYEWVPLESLTDKEEAELRKLDAETAQIHINSGVLDPAEERLRIANDPKSLYPGLDPDDVPEPPDPTGGEGGGEGEAPGGGTPPGAEKPKDAFGDEDPFAEDAWNEGEHPRGQPGNAGQFGSGGGGGGGGKQTLHAPQYGLQHGRLTASHGSSSSTGGAAAPSSSKSSSSKKTNVGEAIDPKGLEKVGKQMGSNPGGVYKDAGGKSFYVKKGKSPDHVRNEMTAAALYHLAGTPTLKYRPVEGGNHIATEMADLDKDNASKLSPEEKREATKDFAVHAWLGNWDAVGLGGDNLGTVKGKPTALDLGGALEYRAQGGPKGKAFGTSVGELETLRDAGMNKDAAGVFGDMTPAQMRESARFVTSLSDAKIRMTVQQQGGDDALADKLIARRDDIAKKARLFGAEGDPKKKTSTMVVPIGEALPVKELNGVKFAPWAPPKDWSAVDGQIALDEPELALPKDKTAASGVVIREPDGRVWLVQPRGAYGGYEATFPKGGAEKGLSLQANAIKEAFEESGLKVRIVSHLGDHEGDSTMTRYYVAEREGGDPSQHEDEAEGVVLAPRDKVPGFLSRTRDRNVAKSLGDDQALQALDDWEESKHPREKGGENAGQFTSGSGGSSAGSEKSAETAKAKKSAFGGLWKDTPGESPAANFHVNATHVLGKATNAGSSYRQMLAHMIKEAPKHGHESMVPNLKKKLGEAFMKAADKAADEAAKQGEESEKKKLIDIAKKAIEKAKEYGAFANMPEPSAPAPKPAPSPPPPKPAAAAPQPAAAPPSAPPTKYPPPTESELAKAKKNVALQLQYVPGAPSTPLAQKLVDTFNEKYAGKEMKTQPELIQKVNDFKALQAAMVPLMNAEQQKAAKSAAELAEQNAINAANIKKQHEQTLKNQKALLEQQKEKLKKTMVDLGISETQAEGFNALVGMLGGKTADVVSQFQSYEAKAKSFKYPISGFQAALVANYTNGGYHQVNKQLRSGTWSAATHVYVKMVNQALQKMPTYAGVVTRGTTLDAKTQQLYVEGNVVEERAFTSSSISSPFSGNTTFTITAIGKRGAHVKKLSNHKSEDEVVFSARTFFKVTKVQGSPGGQMHVHMEEWED